ncbi:unnamed protein product [Rotaria sp. Silwood2]|nr:unnamed protein product [Rotaria sp. Silwood2]CAF4420843.1 unnamed protein product [Rotaria sp. Silwood2]
MEWYMLFLFLTGHFSMTQAACSLSIKFYIECGVLRTASGALQLCQSHQMTLLNLTNGTASLTNDIALLNTTFITQNCSGNFWYSSGSQTGLVANSNGLGGLLDSLTNVLSVVLCLIPLLCPATTTTAPILYAFTVCTRTIQQSIIQKCSTPSQRLGMVQFHFNKQNMYGGVLNTFSSRSLITCSGICSSDDSCVGVTFNNETCTLYM